MKGNMIDTAKPGPCFDAESMRAILAGRKTQTRRAIKGCREGDWPFALPRGQPVDRIAWQGGYSTPLPYRVGTVYYARESLEPVGWHTAYRSDGSRVMVDGNPVGWHPNWPLRPTSSFAMPRWAARVFLRIVDVRVQRLCQISDADVLAEGIHDPTHCLLRGLWIARWEQVNGKGSWERDRNRWVAAYTFEIIKPEGV